MIIRINQLINYYYYYQMQMAIVSKPLLKKITFTNQSLLISLIKNLGKGSFSQCMEFQDVKVGQKQAKQQDFYLDESQFQQQNKQHKYFTKFINIEQRQIQIKGQKNPPKLEIQSCDFVYGTNTGIKTVEVINGKICRAIGTRIFIDNSVYPKLSQSQNQGQNNYSHVYDISYLKYDENTSTLFSGGSDKKRSEIIQWKCLPKDKEILVSQRKITLPLSSLNILCLFVIKNHLVCITKCSIQRQSQLLKIQLDSTSSSKKMKYQLQLGKVINFLIGPIIYIANQSGLHKLTQNFQLIKLYEGNQAILALENIDKNHIILSLINGSIQIFNNQSQKIISDFQLSKNKIKIIKLVTKNVFVAAANKQILLFEINSSYKQFKIIQSVKLEDGCKDILINKKSIFFCLQKGKIQQYLFFEQKLKKIANQIEEKFNFGDIADSQQQIQIQQIIFNKQQQKYLYFYNNSQYINVFKIDKQKITNISSIKLTYPIHFIDTFGSIVASICGEKQEQSFLQFYDLTKNKSFFIQKKLPFPQCTCMKFNPSGDKLALGFKNSNIIIFNTKDYKILNQTYRNKISKKEGYFHKTTIQNIIWNKEGSAIKTFSSNNLLYYLLHNSNDKYQLLLYCDQNKKDKIIRQILEQKIIKAQWIQMGKFNYKTYSLMDQCAQTNQYKQLKQAQKYIFASHSDGFMKVYNNPIDNPQNLQNISLFRHSYKFLIADINDNIISLLVNYKRILLILNLKNCE